MTNSFSEVGAYEFTTLTCVPGVVEYKGAKIQMLDLPGIIEGAKDGKGRGKQVIAVARTCNLILIVLDATRPAQHKRIIEVARERECVRVCVLLYFYPFLHLLFHPTLISSPHFHCIHSFIHLSLPCWTV